PPGRLAPAGGGRGGGPAGPPPPPGGPPPPPRRDATGSDGIPGLERRLQPAPRGSTAPALAGRFPSVSGLSAGWDRSRSCRCRGFGRLGGG
ncbi:MAG: hypothetical protein F4228_08815, partial [Acidobacteria bacterium]|nr:hypothetical protein [Acidobacteriota bacterium]